MEGGELVEGGERTRRRGEGKGRTEGGEERK